MPKPIPTIDNPANASHWQEVERRRRIDAAVRANPDITWCAECGCTVSRSHVHDPSPAARSTEERPACTTCGRRAGMRPYVECEDGYHVVVRTDDGFEPQGWHPSPAASGEGSDRG